MRGSYAGAALLLLASSLAAEPPAIRFEDATSMALADVVPYTQPRLRLESVVDAIGSGLAVLDFDGDGRPDVYLAAPVAGRSSGPPEASGRLLRQLPGGNFEDVTRQTGAWEPPLASGVASADYDGDGWPDLAIAGRGGVRLLHNEAGHGFRDVTAEAGIAGPVWGTTPLFFDADGDGRLDLFIPSFVEFDPSYRVYFRPDGFPTASAYMPAEPRLYRNLGNGKFADVTRESGLAHPMRVLGALACDLDGDGRQDLYLACDGMQSELFMNRGKGSFERAGPSVGVWYPEGGEGAGFHGVALWAGATPDGRPGLLATDNSFGALFRPGEGKGYEDLSIRSGLAEAIAATPGWGCVVADLDNDGEEDVFVTRGGYAHPATAEARVLQGLGEGRFRDVTEAAGPALAGRAVGRACVAADLNGDGALDILETALDRPLRILRGVPSEAARALKLRLVGAGANRDAIGAKVRVTAGDRTWRREIASGGFLSSAPRTVFIGVGSRETVDSVEILWPSGKTQQVTVQGVPAAIVEVKEP